MTTIPPELNKGEERIEPAYDWPSAVSTDELTIVVPTLNEEDGVGIVIENIRKAGFRKILVLDGGSTDKTVDVARALGASVVLQHGRGKTDAIDTAVGMVRTEFVGFIDADGTYDPADFHKMLAYAGMADMVIGSRILNRKGEKKPFVAGHGVVNRLFNRAFNFIYASSITDILSGIRICKTETLRGLRLRSRGFGIEAEMSAQILAEGGKIIEVPVFFGPRIGTAKLQYRDGYHILATILRLAYEFNPLLFFIPISALVLTPGLLLLAWVALEDVSNHIFHSGWALVGLGLAVVGIQIMSFSILSFLMKRIEYRQLRAIRKNKF